MLSLKSENQASTNFQNFHKHLKARYQKHILNFKRAAGTSRNTLTEKPSWFLILEENDKTGIGEVGIIPGLSPDNVDQIEAKLDDLCSDPGYFSKHIQLFKEFPAIIFALETALLDLNSKDPFVLFENDFSKKKMPIEINGLIWMGDKGFVKEQFADLLEKGFTCIKMKVGAIDFDSELKLLGSIRKEYSEDQIELRVDANGAFSPKNAKDKLNSLAAFSTSQH